MSKFLRIMAKVMPVLMVIALIGGNVLLANNGIEGGLPENLGGTADPHVEAFAGNVWSTVKVVIQILAVAAIVFAGIRYMFSSADTKADIKTQTITIVVGALLVFAAVPLTQFIANVATSIVPTNK